MSSEETLHYSMEEERQAPLPQAPPPPPLQLQGVGDAGKEIEEGPGALRTKGGPSLPPSEICEIICVSFTHTSGITL